MKQKGLRLLAVLVALCVLAGVLALAGSAWVVTTTKSQLLTPDDTPPADADCILVLGCSVRPDGTPSGWWKMRDARVVVDGSAADGKNYVLSAHNDRWTRQFDCTAGVPVTVKFSARQEGK